MKEQKIKRILLKVICIVLVAVLIFSLSSCGKKKFVGSWYSLDDPDDDVLIISKDKQFSYDGMGGTVSEIDGGFIINTGWDSVVAMYTKYEGAEAIIIDDDEIFLKDYSKAKELYDKKMEEKRLEEEEKERIRQEEEKKRIEEERLAKEEEERKREEGFQGAEKVIESFRGKVMTGYGHNYNGVIDENDSITVTFREDGTCYLENVYTTDWQFSSSFNSYDGKLVRGEEPGQFVLNVSNYHFYYGFSDDRKNERVEENPGEGYNVTFSLIQEGNKYKTDEILVSGGAPFQGFESIIATADKTTIENSKTEEPKYDINDFVGEYSNGRAGVTITAEGDNMSVFIHWSSSATMYSEWTMSGEFDETTGVMEYADAEVTHYGYDEYYEIMEDEDLVLPEDYTNGTGRLIFNNDDSKTTFIWQDDMEDAGKDQVFEQTKGLIRSGLFIGDWAEPKGEGLIIAISEDGTFNIIFHDYGDADGSGDNLINIGDGTWKIESDKIVMDVNGNEESFSFEGGNRNRLVASGEGLDIGNSYKIWILSRI